MTDPLSKVRGHRLSSPDSERPTIRPCFRVLTFSSLSVLVFNDRHLTKPFLYKSLLYSSTHPHPELSTSKILLLQTSTRILFLTNCGSGNRSASEKSSERVIAQLRQKTDVLSDHCHLHRTTHDVYSYNR